jgi:hypothetical protein
VAQILNKDFTENTLIELRDAELLELCVKLDLISENDFYMLDQCRDMRNNFSSAHPSIGQIDDRELINFLSRCCKHGLNSEPRVRGIDISSLLTSIKGNQLNEDQIKTWVESIRNTITIQRQSVFPMMYGIYCDPSSTQPARLNSLRICMSCKGLIDEKTQSQLLEQHNQYLIKGETDKQQASTIFFEKIGYLSLLSESERHSIIKKACDNLVSTHLAFYNFYNEPSFAERLLELTKDIAIPNLTQSEFVYAVTLCFVGNQYGISVSAQSYYSEMITNFSPKEIDILLNQQMRETSILTNRLKYYRKCRERYIEALQLIDQESMTSIQKERHQKAIEELAK